MSTSRSNPCAGWSILRLDRTLIGCLALSVLSASPARAQDWALQVGTSQSDFAADLAPDGSGGFYEVGWTMGAFLGSAAGYSDSYVLRRSAAGDLLWGLQFGVAEGDGAFGVTADGAGGVLVAGTVTHPMFPIGTNSVYVTRFAGAGTQLWSDAFDAGPTGIVRDAASDGAGGIFAVGEAESSVFGPYTGVWGPDLWLVRYDGLGNRLWGRQFGSPLGDNVYSAIEDGNGGVLLCGATAGTIGSTQTTLTNEGWYASFDALGNQVWVRQFGAGQNVRCSSIARDGQGGYYLLGDTLGTLAAGGGGGKDVFLRRVDAAGNELWTIQFGSDAEDLAQGVVVAPDGSVIATGSSVGALGGINQGAQDVWLGRFSSDGTQTGLLQFGNETLQACFATVSDGNGGAFLSGLTLGDLFSTSAGKGDIWSAHFTACDLAEPQSYCASAPNSTGLAASIGSTGTASIAQGSFTLSAKQCPVGQIGLFLLGDQQASAPFGDGLLCVGGSVSRLLPAQLVDGAGNASHPLDFGDANSPASQITPGSTWYFQFWYRDPDAGGAGFNLSDGLSATFCP